MKKFFANLVSDLKEAEALLVALAGSQAVLVQLLTDLGTPIKITDQVVAGVALAAYIGKKALEDSTAVSAVASAKPKS